MLADSENVSPLYLVDIVLGCIYLFVYAGVIILSISLKKKKPRIEE